MCLNSIVITSSPLSTLHTSTSHLDASHGLFASAAPPHYATMQPPHAQPPPQPLQAPQHPQQRPVNGTTRPSPQPSSLQPNASASHPAPPQVPLSSFPVYQAKLHGRLQQIFTASSELLLSDDAGHANRLLEHLEGFYALGDQALMYLMESDGLLSIDSGELLQSALPLTLSSTLPAYHTHPFQLMQQQLTTTNKLRFRHQLLTQVSAAYLPHPPPRPPQPNAASEVVAGEGRAEREAINLTEDEGGGGVGMEVEGGRAGTAVAQAEAPALDVIAPPDIPTEQRSVMDLTNL